MYVILVCLANILLHLQSHGNFVMRLSSFTNVSRKQDAFISFYVSNKFATPIANTLITMVIITMIQIS